ncbi:MAG: FAD-binding oxidoreductase, partial [Thermodesulfobacteriota bacterium]
MARRVGTESPWVNGGRGSERAPLAADVEADVCVIGAGIAGLSTAYMLQRDGASVVVLDDGPVGGGQTGRTTAHLSNALDDRYTELERLHGAEGARYAAASHTAAIARIEEIVREEGLECDFARVDGFLFAPEASAMRPATTPPPTTLPDLLLDELAAARRAGVPGVEQAVRAPLVSFDTGPCLRFPGQGRFEPIRYLDGLAAAFERRGGRLFTGTHATTVTGGAAALVGTAPGHRVSCGAIVVATNTPVNDRFVIHTKQAPYLTYVIAARVPHGSVPDVLLWDTADPYHYVRLQPAAGDGDARQDLLIVGGEDHKTGQASDGERRFASLEGWTRERFPMVEGVVRRWAGQVMEPSDGAAFIGRNPSDADNVYVATGDSGHGMTHGTIAGMLLADLIAGRPNPWAALYDPARISLASA